MPELLLPFVLLVLVDTGSGPLVVPAGRYETYRECYVKGKELQLLSINKPKETEGMQAAGCAECSRLPEYCGGTEL